MFYPGPFECDTHNRKVLAAEKINSRSLFAVSLKLLAFVYTVKYDFSSFIDSLRKISDTQLRRLVEFVLEKSQEVTSQS